MAGRAHHVYYDRLLRLCSAFVLADADWLVQIEVAETASWSVHRAHSKFYERLPMPKRHIRIDDRNFFCLRKRLYLLVGQFLAEKWNHGVPAGQDTMCRSHRVQL